MQNGWPAGSSKTRYRSGSGVGLECGLDGGPRGEQPGLGGIQVIDAQLDVGLLTEKTLEHFTMWSARPPACCAWSLAGRMALTERTTRRDIAKLRELGYAVESEPGPWGGYRLRAGSRLPVAGWRR